ncbi:MAG: hypothetical protein KGL10_09835 [Alphaproteobacteria bacterium]|nr:hypothetical protein [Alphaproteobacteria bacterium]
MRNKRTYSTHDLGLTRRETDVLKRLTTPEKIQDYVSRLKNNEESGGDTCLSVRQVLRQRHAHCIEGAFVAAAALWLHGYPPLLMDMKAKDDDDHVVALVRRGRYWGAISKSNHVWLRWRDPVYRSLRELAMSYLHGYVSPCNRLSLRSYSRPFDLRKHDSAQWVTNEGSCWDIALELDQSRHYDLITPVQARHLRPHDKIQLRAGQIVEHPGKT